MIYTLEKLTLKEFIRVAIINKRLKANKPVSVSIEGESGAGKSILTVLIACYMKQLLNAKCSIFNHLIYTPADFEKVVDHVFFSNECDLPAIFVQETVSFSPSWLSPFSKKNPALKIYSILVLSREIKPVAFFVCEQQFSDLYKRLRLRMNMFFKVIRYVSSDGKSLQPILKIYEKVGEVGDKILFAEPIIFFNRNKLYNPFFIIPKLNKNQLEAFRQLDFQFKAEQIRKIAETISKTDETKKKSKKKEDQVSKEQETVVNKKIETVKTELEKQQDLGPKKPVLRPPITVKAEIID